MAPWTGPRRWTWASDTVVVGAVLVILVIITAVVDQLNGPDTPPPVYLTGLVGAASAALFAAMGSDKGKREAELTRDVRVASETGNRAEAKADTLAGLARAEHPEHRELDEPPITDSADGGAT